MSRTVVVTGGSGALGRPLVERFLQLGDHVFATTLRPSSLEELHSSFGASGRFSGVACDLAGEATSSEILEAIPVVETAGIVLINNARSRETLRVDVEGLVGRDDFVQEYVLDVVVPYELTMRFSQRFRERLTTVINIGSMYGSVAVNPALYVQEDHSGFIHYGTAKAALHHLTRELAVRLAAHGTRVNAVAYGGLEGRGGSDFLKRYAAMSPSRRMLRSEDVPEPVVFLASQGASGVNGHVLAVDGGWTIW